MTTYMTTYTQPLPTMIPINDREVRRSTIGTDSAHHDSDQRSGNLITNMGKSADQRSEQLLPTMIPINDREI